MTIERQKTFGDTVGMAQDVPTQSHRDDWVECSDGSVRRNEDVLRDCRDNAHGSEEAQHEADVEIVTEVLNAVNEQVTEYCTENSDYADAYSHIISEVSHEWPDRVKDWVKNNYHDRMGYGRFDDCLDKLVDAMCEHLDGAWDCEAEYSANEYADYSGPGGCLWGTDIGEEEEQIDISCFDELQELHNQGRLDDVLDDVNCDAYVSRSKRRVKNEETGYYEEVGRKTYLSGINPDVCPCLMIYHSPGGRWDWIVSVDRMDELVALAIIDLVRKADTKRAD